MEAFGPFLRAQDPPRLTRLVDGLPDLARLFVDLRLPAPEPLGDPSLEKTRLFEAVARLLERMARECPTVLFFDDLHWADPASLELLHYLARGLADQPVLLVAACRAEEIDRARGLSLMLKTMQRAGNYEEVSVRRLDDEAVGTLVQAMLGGGVPSEVVSVVAGRTGGTPLFVEALTRALVDSGHLFRDKGDWILILTSFADLIG